MTDFSLPPGEPYTGPAGGMSTSKWLRGEDIPMGQIVPVVVESVIVRRKVQFRDGDEPQDIYSLKLTGKQKEVRINATVRKAMTELFGADTKTWKGKRIGLQTVYQMVAGKRLQVIDVVRVPDGAPAQPPKGDPAPEADDANDPGDMSQIPF